MSVSKRHIMLLAIAFLLPVGFIAVLVVNATLASSRLQTAYDFVYATCENPGYTPGAGCLELLAIRYPVSGEQLHNLQPSIPAQVTDSTQEQMVAEPQARFFRHDPDTDQSREIIEAEIEGLQLSRLLNSPDGIRLTQEFVRTRGLWPFVGYSSRYGVFLVQGEARREMAVIGNGNYYPGNFKFIGWVLE